MGLAVLVIAILILAEPFVADLPHTLKKVRVHPPCTVHTCTSIIEALTQGRGPAGHQQSPFSILCCLPYPVLLTKLCCYLDLSYAPLQAVIKSLAGQVTLFPTYTSLVLMYATLLEGGDLRQGLEKVRERLPKLFIVGSV
jgi:hypothetical protein